ncbi:PLP-dependent transferase [Porticoccus sp. W117]|uniref:trans-sulfuration enzyme family protein n=1 Tax=Porticoccus sp. W117 TaxID=3054777 RepID=UPI002593267D|nr:PLP-dependent transferase [Porticoccus sp. W117]MDM3872476.1 PLP-dependent transferase [Porticoccus sp. W117]
MNDLAINLAPAKALSPVRNSSEALHLDQLVDEQLAHFNIDADSELGRALGKIAHSLYQCQGGVDDIWQLAQSSMQELDRSDRIALFNAKKFLSFQIAKILDNFQNSFRKSYQGLGESGATQAARCAYPILDNVTALFSATPVIARTATYTFACADWIADAFEGKEFMLQIYSRLLNPTSIALANHIVDLECGPHAGEYMAWNYNSGMAAIDGTLSHVLGHEDVLIASRNIYGGAHQLIHDWFAKPSNLNIGVEQYDGFGVEEFMACWREAKAKYAGRLQNGKQAYLYIESPCNPHGYVLDVPALCKAAHAEGLRVILDATVGTPVLQQPLRHPDTDCRPDFMIHSYTKDLTGTGSVIAGGVIARNEDMFIPKGMPGWENTMFWNVYYIKGAFLSADSAFEVLQGMRTLNLRVINKAINTEILANYFAAHPGIRVNCHAVPGNENYALKEQHLKHGLPAPLFTFDMGSIPKDCFQRFFDALEPAYSHQISLGQTNTIVSCPGLTTHSELSEEDQKKGSIYPTTVRISLGCENPKDLIVHFAEAAKLTIDPVVPGFSAQLMGEGDVNRLITDTYMKRHQLYVESLL